MYGNVKLQAIRPFCDLRFGRLPILLGYMYSTWSVMNCIIASGMTFDQHTQEYGT